MFDYKAPLRDIKFAMQDVLDFESHYKVFPRGEEASPEVVDAVLTEFAKFCESAVVPINRNGDEEGCHFENGVVTTPKGYKEAYQQYAESGWPSLSSDVEYDGQGLPASLSKVLCEIVGSSSLGFTLYTAGQSGAIETIAEFGTEEQRDIYERRLSNGTWNATMCLTEPHCGTDLGLLKTKAIPQNDGTYDLTGTKIFITGGEHDLTENIVHIVLARLPDAPKGTKGISMFIVPKFLTDTDGNLVERNSVHCGSIEHKMGAKASATCVMNFDNAKGFLIGEENKGLMAMFTFMNAARIATATQGVMHAEYGYQKSLAYAKDRLQMRSLSGPKNPDGPADPIIVHPDVRRMLLTQKVFAEGNRLLIYSLSKKLDLAAYSDDPEIKLMAKSQLDFLTPIAKAFATETGYESANLAVQCFGGHGYIREWGVEQNVRDARIGMLYEGTTGIQALDLLGRKVLGSKGEMLANFTREILNYCESQKSHPAFSSHADELVALVHEWETVTSEIAQKSAVDPDEIGAASVNYLMYSGYICLAYFWLQAAVVADKKINEGDSESTYYESKVKFAEFYFQHILPRTTSCIHSIKAGAESIMSPSDDHLQLWG